MVQASSISVREYPFLVGGRWISEGEAIEVRSPYDNSVVGQTFRATRAQAAEAVGAAVQAFEVTRKLPAGERYRALRQVSHTLASRRDEFARLIALEAGKPMKAARAEVERAVFTFQVAAEEAQRIRGEYLPMDLQAATVGRIGLVRRFPVGPVLAITPFNFPLNLVAHKVAPAMACGCTVVLKPAPKTPLSALALAEIIQQTAWPAGALNVLPLANDDAEVLVHDERLKVLSFTGSAPVGWALKAQAGKKRVLLELGGNAACLIHGDADLGFAAERCAVGGFSYAGQSCISVQRILVEQRAHQAFLDFFVPLVQKLKLGDPLDEQTDVGPMVREAEAVRAASWVKEAVSAGAKLLFGGGRRGALLEPTVLTRTTPQMKVNCEEVFAPVVTVEPYDDFDQALARANDSPYGLQAGLFTHDARLIFRAYEELEVGGLIVGDVPTFRIDHMPYGGVKDSGLGREGLRYAIEEMTERRLLVLDARR